jgi:probable F420-dependent oxidoreductase
VTGNSSVGIFPASTDYSMPIVDLAVAAEERGFTSMFLNEHTHMPVEHPRSPFPAGGRTPRRYAHFWDPLVALSFVASQTSLTVGTAVCLAAEHDPIALAKATASLDVLSGGRLVLGVGYGWNREEYEDHRPDCRQRAEVVIETVECMRALWSEEEAEYEGRFISVSRSWAWPKPLQRPSIPVLIGARPGPGDRNFERIARHADGWIPMGSALDGPEFEADLRRLRGVWERAGRDPAGLRIICIQAPCSVGTFRARLERAVELGVEHVLLLMKDEPADQAKALLDAVAPALGTA